MVNKGSFFQRLKERWGSGSGVRVEKPAAEKRAASTNRSTTGSSSSGGSSSGGSSSSGSTKPHAAAKPAGKPAAKPAAQPHPAASRVEAERTNGNSHAVSSTFQPAEARSTRKMSDREEAMMAVGHHFQELAQLMKGAQAANDEKLQQIVDATSSMPALGQQQLEALKALSTQMDKQNALGVQLSATMTKLPSLLENVETALDRAAKTAERTAATVREFQSTMDRIHTSMDKMVDNSNQQASAAKQLAERRTEELEGLAKDISRSQEGAVDELKRANEESLTSLRRTHEDQSNRLQRVVQEHAGWNRAVLVGIGLVVIGIGAVIVLQLVK
jgi:methyl-accepting chemotaxis protein